MKKFALILFVLGILLLPKSLLASDEISVDMKIPEMLVTQEEESWKLCRFNFYFENDFFLTTDSQYTSGEKFNWLFHVDNQSNPLYNLLFIDYGNYDAYVSFSLVNQIYTPVDLNQTEPIVDDRPYAGWTYFEYGIHKSSSENLRSLYLRVGMIGPASKSEQIQKGIHKLSGSDTPKGWDNQLESELGINLVYFHKWRFIPEKIGVFERSIIPFVEVDLGNVSTKVTAGVSMRFGYNIARDFGISTVDSGGEVGVSVKNERMNVKKRDWSFSFNLSGYGSAIARDIFLDGNTFKDSHSIDKENLVAYVGFGFTARYKNLMSDFILTKSTPKFKGEETNHTVGTLILSWLY